MFERMANISVKADDASRIAVAKMSLVWPAWFELKIGEKKQDAENNHDHLV
jgi:hypothetical protein